MVTTPLKLTAEQRQDILQHCNDVMHEKLVNGETIFVATQCKDDPRKFTIVADGIYDKKLEGVKVIFDNPEDFKNIFPEFTTTIPTTEPPGGNPDHVDPYVIRKVATKPKIIAEEYNPNNILDDNPDTRLAHEGELFVILDMGREIEIGAVWIQWLNGLERQAIFTLGVSNSPTKFALVPGFDKVYSSGETDDYEGYNLSSNVNELTKGQFILIKVDGNTNNDWSTIRNVKVTKAIAIKSMQTKVKKGDDNTTTEPTEPTTEPTEPTEPTTEPTTEPGGPVVPSTGKAPMPAENRKYNPETVKKNKAKKLTGMVPLIDKKNADGIAFPDLRTLFKNLGYANIIRDFNYNRINTKPKENNNDGDENGKSLRLDFKEYMEQFMTIVKMKNQAKAIDDISLKYGGIHSKGNDDIWADCLIVRMKADGKSIATQLEPRHMAPDPFGYGEYFNEISGLDVGDTRGKFYHYMHIKVNDIVNNRVIVVFAVDKSGTGNQFQLVYLSEIYDGMGGERVLKAPFAQWAYQVKKDLSKCNITVRMDAQQNFTLKKGSNYDQPMCIEIVDG